MPASDINDFDLIARSHLVDYNCSRWRDVTSSSNPNCEIHSIHPNEPEIISRSKALEPSYGIMANSKSMISWMKTLMIYSNQARLSPDCNRP